MILPIVLLGILSIVDAANVTCASSEYYNANLSLCIACPVGCSACCDEAVCSACVSGTFLLK
jgi:hypothetical protein